MLFSYIALSLARIKIIETDRKYLLILLDKILMSYTVKVGEGFWSLSCIDNICHCLKILERLSAGYLEESLWGY